MSKKIVIPTRATERPSADQWVSNSTENDESAPRVKPKRLTIDIHPDLHRRLKLHCVERDQEIATLMRELIERCVGPTPDPIVVASQSS